MVLTRRWFLIGGSAVVAATALPALPLLEPPPLISRASFQDLFPYREIVDLMFAPGPGDGPSFLKLIRPGEQCIFDTGVGARGFIRWVPIAGDEIIVTEETAFRIEVTPSPAGAQVCTVFNVQPDRKKMPRMFSETFGWDKDGVLVAPPPVPLHAGDDGLTPADLLKDDPPRPPKPPVEEMSDEEYDRLFEDDET